jgi:hypothetical protein
MTDLKCFVVCLSALLLAAFAESRAGAQSRVPAERVLLLRTGRVVKGRLRQISTGWLVSAKHGHVVIPFDQVRLDADDIEEVYLSLRLKLLRNPTVGNHLNLADWCLSQKLLREASLEVRSAMELDPANETARLMLKRLEAHVNRAIASRKPRETPAKAEVRVDLGPADGASRVHSLAGLKPETARQFVTTIQPILFNRCGNARCHGPSASNGFQLDRFRVGAGTHRLKSERNLATILEHVDPTDPGASAVLEVTRGSHAGQSVFHGPVAARQIELVTTWLHAAVAELYPNAARNRTRQSPFQPQLPLVSQTRTTVAGITQQSPIRASELSEPGNRESHPASLVSPAPVTTQLRNPTGQPPSESTISRRQPKLVGFQDVLRQTENSDNEPDAFDPDEFNRKYAGRGSAGN